uniref:ribosomal protein L5 n=1 Tax=Dictyotopsis propagulifera TaxID=670095 RepID=UPI002E75B176|nr:ribosomal protein L5 [Dictyotopsis propagulifera]WBP69949.1 ribosomal protein L5 [Dictyotopsis propagulifera]
MWNPVKLHYQTIVQQDLILMSQISGVFKIPKLIKMTILVMHNKNSHFDQLKGILSTAVAVSYISYQKPFFIVQSKKNLKKIVGCKVTIRKKKYVFFFFFLLLIEIFPKISQFKGFFKSIPFGLFNFNIKNFYLFKNFLHLFFIIDNLKVLNCQLHFNSKDEINNLILSKSLLICFK